ncbi:MAG: chromate resistance protein ChrB domain-containing protein [Anaeromyxobacteraceae bacterium]
MNWITRAGVKVDRVACPWLIRKFIDREAEFLFVPTEQVAATAQREGATPYDTAGAEMGHRGKECSFDAFCRKYQLLEKDPALALLAKIVNGADTDNSLWNQPESWGLKAIAEGFRHLGLRDDHEINRAEWIVYDALYAYCQQCLAKGHPEGAFRKAS